MFSGAPAGVGIPVARERHGDQGCVVFFPGLQDSADHDDASLFTALEQAGLLVYPVAYASASSASSAGSAVTAGTAGTAAGTLRTTTLAQLEAAAPQSVAHAVARCGRSKTVVAGRAFGATIAALGSNGTHPAGLVLVSASPTLASAVRAHLRDRAWTRPLALLPIAQLLQDDFTLSDIVPSGLHVVIFQGDADARAPIAELWPDDTQPAQPPIVAIPGGTHASALRLAQSALVATTLDMIRGSQAEEAAGGEDN